MRCCVPFCNNTSDNVSPSEGEGNEISFHALPSEVHLRTAWLRALGQQENLPDCAVVCSLHFLSDDIFETESGLRQIRTGAIPSTVQVCMICLDTDSKMLLMSKHKLEEAYEKLTGQPLCDQGNLKQTLCVQCAQRLINFSRFRDKSLRARALMMDLVGKHELITREHIQMINRSKHQLQSNMVLTTLGPDHWDLHILEHPSEDNYKELEETRLEGIMKIEGNDDSMSVDEDIEVTNEDDNNADNVKNEFITSNDEDLSDYSIMMETRALDEALYKALQMKHVYMRRMSANLENGGGDGECETSQVCKPHTAVSSSSAHSSLITENRQADPSTSTHSAMTLAVPLPARLATNIEMKSSTEQADTDASGRHTTLTDCFVKLYDIFPEKVVPRRDGSLTKTQKQSAVRSCVSQYVASKHVRYQATSQKEVLATEYIEPVTREENMTVSKTVYICDICQKMFKQKSLLVKHIRRHALAHRFTCKICQYKSYHKNYFRVHMRTHTAEKPYHCKLCKYKCKNNSKLVLHIRTHTGEKPYPCKLCESKFLSNDHLVRHMKIHTGEKPYHCKLCKYKCARNAQLMRHIRTHTGEKPYHCKFCEYKCTQSCLLVRHMRTHTGEKPYHCKLCKYKCKQNGGLVLHMRTHTGEKPYPCEICERKFLSNAQLVWHMRTHTGEKPYNCKLCDYKCAQSCQLVSHMRSHTGEKPYNCKLCDYKCAQSCQLVLHMRSHTGEKPYNCKLCDYKCAQSSLLVLHMRSHTGEKPYNCKLCDYKCAQSCQLVSHMRSHTGEKPYNCKLCDYKCAQSCQLVLHMRSHTGEKPYHCKLCDYKCAQSCLLVVHMRTHSGEMLYHCKLCKYKSNHKSNFVRHMKTHTGEKPYRCKLCESKFLSNGNLVRHMRTHTGEKPYHCKLCKYKCKQSSNLVGHMRTHTGEKPYHCKLCKYKCNTNSGLLLHMRTHTSEKLSV